MNQEFDYPANRSLPTRITLKQRTVQMTEGGLLSAEPVKHTYVRLSVLPDELKRRVIETIKILESQGV